MTNLVVVPFKSGIMDVCVNDSDVATAHRNSTACLDVAHAENDAEASIVTRLPAYTLGGGMVIEMIGGGDLRFVRPNVAVLETTPRKLRAVTLRMYSVSKNWSARACVCVCVFVSVHAVVFLLSGYCVNMCD